MADSPLLLPVPQAVEALLSLEDEEALEAALASVSPAVAAQAVNAAPDLERKTSLLWAMEDRQRREALEAVPAAVVAALVQNLEDDNRYLLGDLSLEAFRALLDLCSPERKYYWILTALSFTDARANALPLLLPTSELVEILLTRGEFEEHLRALGDYPLEDQRLPPEIMVDPAQGLVDYFGAENLLRQFPIADSALAGILQLMLDYDPDRYVDVIREGLRQADYAENHPLEWETLTEAPVLLDRVEVRGPAGTRAASEASPEPAESETEDTPVWLAPVAASPLARLTAELAPAQRFRVAGEIQHLYIRQAIAEGGSFLRSDLERTARSVEGYLLLGLEAESGGDARRAAEVLGSRPLRKVSETGAALVERLRQVALRLRPLEAVLDAEQRALVRSLASPRVTLAADGTPRLALLPGGSLPGTATAREAAARLEEVAAWTTLARALGLERTAGALQSAGSVEHLLEELVLAAVLYARLDPSVTEPSDRERFTRRYVRSAFPTPEARQGLRETVGSAGLQSAARAALPLLEAALERLAAAG